MANNKKNLRGQSLTPITPTITVAHTGAVNYTTSLLLIIKYSRTNFEL